MQYCLGELRGLHNCEENTKGPLLLCGVTKVALLLCWALALCTDKRGTQRGTVTVCYYYSVGHKERYYYCVLKSKEPTTYGHKTMQKQFVTEKSIFVDLGRKKKKMER